MTWHTIMPERAVCRSGRLSVAVSTISRMHGALAVAAT
jgi:hypothetical protein